MRGSENQDRVRQNQGSRGRSRLCVLFRISWAPCHLLCWPELRRGEVTCPPRIDWPKALHLLTEGCGQRSQQKIQRGVHRSLGFVKCAEDTCWMRSAWEKLPQRTRTVTEVGVHLPRTFPPTGRHKRSSGSNGCWDLYKKLQVIKSSLVHGHDGSDNNPLHC